MAPMSVYIGGLDADIQKEDLEKEFSHFGDITKVWVARNPPGFAFIDFQNDDDASEAIKRMNGVIINRSKIRVDASRGRSRRGRVRNDRGVGFQGGHGGRGGFGKGQADSFHSDFRHRGRDFLRGGSMYQGGGIDRSSGYHSRSYISQSSDIEWKPVGLLDCPELVKAYEDSSKCKSSGKRKLCGAENICSESTTKKKAFVEELNDAGMNINCLPEEILMNIFHYLKQNELGRIARVCKWWYQIASYPALWKKVNVLVRESESQNKVALSVSENLPMCVTHLKLDCQAIFYKGFLRREHLEIDTFCMRVGKRCPSLKALVLHHVVFSINLQTVIDLCIQYLQNLEILSIHNCHFTAYSFKVEYGDHCKIRVLDLGLTDQFGNSWNKLAFSKMSNLKKLILPGSFVLDSWFGDDTSFLANLEVLDLQSTLIHSGTFQALKNHALKLTDLYLCNTHLQDRDFRFSSSVFPKLKTLCLKFCFDMTCEALVYLVRACPSLQNVYVDHKMAASYAQHPFIIANKCKLKIVKSTYVCSHIVKDYLYEE